MPRRRTDAPLYRRADSPYWWTFTYTNGRRQRVSTKCTDREAALSTAAKLQRQAADPRLVHADETVADALVAYAEQPLARARGTMIAIEQRAVALARVLGAVKLRELSRAHVAMYIQKRAKGYRTLKAELDLLRAAVRLARLHGRQVVEAEALAVPIPGVVTPKTRWLRQDEVDALCDVLRPHRGDWVRVAVWTGCRKEEVNGLRWGDVDRERGVIRVRGTKGLRRNGEARNVSDRSVPLCRAFREWLDVMSGLGASPLPQERLVAPWLNLKTVLSRACEVAGVDYCTAHDFRRTFASRLKQRGVDSMVVAKLLGHTTSRLVDTVYGHLDVSTLTAAVRLLDE